MTQASQTGLRDALEFIYEIAADGGCYTVNGQMVDAADLLTALADEHGVANENDGPLWSQIADRIATPALAPSEALEQAREALAPFADIVPSESGVFVAAMADRVNRARGTQEKEDARHLFKRMTALADAFPHARAVLSSLQPSPETEGK